MPTNNFDRVRPRQASPSPTPADRHDPEGKRALFSATAPGIDRPGVGSVAIECSGCDVRSVVSVGAAMRLAFPSLILGLDINRGDQTTKVGVGPDHPVWMRCPACRKRHWSKVSLTI